MAWRSWARPHNLNGVHRFGIHPMDAPNAGMGRFFPGWLVADGAVRAMIASIRS